MEERVITNEELPSDNNLEETLRPQVLDEYIGQNEVKENNSYIVTIKDLVDKGYIGSTNGDVTDIRDGSSMLNMKIHLIYDEEKDTVYAQVV